MTRRGFLAAVPLGALLAADEPGFTPLVDGWTVQDGPESAFYNENGDTVVHESAGFPAWLRSARQFRSHRRYEQ